MPTSYPFNPTAASGPNSITGELHTLAPSPGAEYNFLVPTYAPFFSDGLVISITPTQQSLGRYTLNQSVTLQAGVDFFFAFEFIGATLNTAKRVFAGLSFVDPMLAGVVNLSYIALGGSWIASQTTAHSLLVAQNVNPRTTAFEDAFNVTAIFPPVIKTFAEQTMLTFTDVNTALAGITSKLTAGVALVSPINYENHITNYNNPHGDTAATYGLSLVPNWTVAAFSDAQNAVATNMFLTPAAVAASLSSYTALPAASSTVFGVGKLNLGTIAGDASDANKALTTAGLLTLKNASGTNAIKALFSYERQILTFVTPIAYPVHCLGTLCNNWQDLVNAVQTSLGFSPIQSDPALACIYLPYDMATPNLTLS